MQNKTFVPGGRGPVEYDCWGFCCEVYRMYGLRLPSDYAAPVENKERSALIEKEKSNTAFLEIPAPKIPCLVTLMIRPPYVSHIGVMIGPTEFIHIMEKAGVLINSTRSEQWKKRIDKYYLYIGDSK